MSIKSRLMNAACFAVFALSGLAHGQDAPVENLGDLDVRQARMVMLNAAVAEAKAQAALDEARSKTNAGTLNASPAQTSQELPTVTDYYGGERADHASFVYPNGATDKGGAGDTIYGGFKIESVQLNHVRLSRGGHVYDLGNSSAPIKPNPPQGQQNVGQVLLTPPPSMPNQPAQN
jgi:type IV pilus biogenesis protein PilP